MKSCEFQKKKKKIEACNELKYKYTEKSAHLAYNDDPFYIIENFTY